MAGRKLKLDMSGKFQTDIVAVLSEITSGDEEEIDNLVVNSDTEFEAVDRNAEDVIEDEPITIMGKRKLKVTTGDVIPLESTDTVTEQTLDKVMVGSLFTVQFSLTTAVLCEEG
eukprot:sb/3476903/